MAFDKNDVHKMLLKIFSLIKGKLKYTMDTNIFKWFDYINRNKCIKNFTLILSFSLGENLHNE